MRIAVLYGGFSSERDISLDTGKNIYNALKNLSYDAILIDVDRNLVYRLKENNIDFCYIALHGKYGEDGRVQGLLDFLNIPYTGSGVLASALAMNKFMSKQLFDIAGIKTPKAILIRKLNFDKIEEIFDLNFPVIVKPNNGGSTIATYVVSDLNQLKEKVHLAFSYDKEVLIEEYIKGREFTVPILGDKILPIIEIIPVVSDFYDYDAKYLDGGSKHIISPDIDKGLKDRLISDSKKAVDILGVEVLARVDFIVDKNLNPYILEVNTIPGMTKNSLLPESANYVNIDFNSLVKEIINLSLKKYDKIS